jgi:hypothetical protein
VVECDALEEPTAEPNVVVGDRIELVLRPFEIRTLRLESRSASTTTPR